MALSTDGVRNLYDVRAKRYDQVLSAYLLAGFRAKHHRARAISALALNRGDTVIDLGCGTGLNFQLLEDAVGTGGKIVGIDLSAGMLDRARHRIRKFTWQNIDLVQADMAEYTFPTTVDGVVSTYAITLSSGYDDVIRRAAEAIRTGRRMAILDIKKPDRWPDWLIRTGAWMYKPFGVSLDLSDRRAWESLSRYLHEISFDEHYLGAAYLAIAERTR